MRQVRCGHFFCSTSLDPTKDLNNRFTIPASKPNPLFGDRVHVTQHEELLRHQTPPSVASLQERGKSCKTSFTATSNQQKLRFPSSRPQSESGKHARHRESSGSSDKLHKANEANSGNFPSVGISWPGRTGNLRGPDSSDSLESGNVLYPPQVVTPSKAAGETDRGPVLQVTSQVDSLVTICFSGAWNDSRLL